MTTENATPATPQEKPAEQTPTETVESLQAKLNELQNQLNKEKDNVRGLNKTLQQRAEEAKKAQDLKSEIAEVKETQKILAAIIAEQRQQDTLDGLPTDRKVDYLNTYNTKVQELEAKRKADEAKAKQDAYAREANEIYEKAKSLFGEGDNLDSIEDLLIDGISNPRKYERAVKKVEQAEKAKKPEPPKESDEARITRLAEERYQAKLKEQGLLTTESAQPSGRTASFRDLEKRYAQGDPNVTTTMMDEARRKEGIF